MKKFELALSKVGTEARSWSLNAMLLTLLFLVWTLISLRSEAAASALGTNTSSQSNTIGRGVRASKNELSAFDGKWSALLRGRETQDEFNQRSLSVLRLDLTTNYHLAPWLKLNLAPTFKTASGHAQTETDSEANKSLLLLRNATADFLFRYEIQLSGGALNQHEVHSPLLMDDRAFPGARAKIKAPKNQEFQWSAFLQNTVPTSSSLATNTKEFEATPNFSSGGVQLGYQSNTLQFHNHLNYFQFNNLPTAIAIDSGLLGNTVLTTNTTDAKFRYEYRGVELRSELVVDWNKTWSSTLEVDAVKNSGAPDGLNLGYLTYGRLDWNFDSHWILSPGISYFNIQPDASVASYADDRFDTNRVGYRASFKATYNKRFRLFTGGGERDVLFQTPNQSREKYFELGLETLDAQF